jgi:hypothetical protein
LRWFARYLDETKGVSLFKAQLALRICLIRMTHLREGALLDLANSLDA